MAFPFSITYKKPLRAIITAENKRQVLDYIKQWMLTHKANNVMIKDDGVIYKGTTSNFRPSMFGSVDKGVLNLVYDDKRSSIFC